MAKIKRFSGMWREVSLSRAALAVVAARAQTTESAEGYGECLPVEWLGRFVVGPEVTLDGLFENSDGFEDAPPCFLSGKST